MCLGTIFLATPARPQTSLRPINLAVLDFADSEIGKLTAARLAARLASTTGLALVDRDLGRAAARGTGYAGSLNLSLSEARDLGAAIGCDFYFTGEAQTLRRSPSSGPPYFESYASLFLVSARTGRLISWERMSVTAASAAESEQLLLARFAGDEVQRTYLRKLTQAQAAERDEREVAFERTTPVLEEANEEGKAGDSFRAPRPYRRLKPSYPDEAAQAAAEGTVDVLVEIDQTGEVKRVDIARWAGFGLDEAALNTARQLHFFPAIRDGIAIPIRALLRYNFRRPAK